MYRFLNVLTTIEGAEASIADVTATDVSASDVGWFASCMSSTWGLLGFYAVIIALFYFVFFRPQKKRRKQEEAMRRNIQLGDNIVTIGGICGRVISIREDDTLVIETGADRDKIKIKSWAVQANETVYDVVETEEPKKKGLFGKKNAD